MEQLNGYEEVHASFTLPEAIQEAQRCLRCKVPQCQKACPIDNDIPEWIHELRKGNLGNAIGIIRAKSNLPAVCGRVCAHERQCEGGCVLGKTGKHIQIGQLERFIADFDAEAKLTHEDVAPKTRGRVAVIGSGPAGITVAGDLSRMGFAVEIFEMESEAGGVLMWGIPAYRLPKEVVRREIRFIEQLGVIVHCNTKAGLDFRIDDLFNMGFDAVFIGIGSGKPQRLEIPIIVDGSDKIMEQQDCDDVRLGTLFLRRAQLYRDGIIGREEVKVMPGQKVFVIGCGNTAMDAARTAVRCGAEVQIVYRRDITRMAALREEYDEAVAEGVKFNWKSNIKEMHADKDGHIYEILLETASEVEGGEPTLRTLPANKVIMAVGAHPSTRISHHGSSVRLDTDDKGFLITRDTPYGMTSRKGVFAGGDVANRQATVVHAMQDAKKVAKGIAQYVDAIKLLSAIGE